MTYKRNELVFKRILINYEVVVYTMKLFVLCTSYTEHGQFDRLCLHSAKGGAVEAGCSDLYGVIHDFTI